MAYSRVDKFDPGEMDMIARDENGLRLVWDSKRKKLLRIADAETKRLQKLRKDSTNHGAQSDHLR